MAHCELLTGKRFHPKGPSSRAVPAGSRCPARPSQQAGLHLQPKEPTEAAPPTPSGSGWLLQAAEHHRNDLRHLWSVQQELRHRRGPAWADVDPQPFQRGDEDTTSTPLVSADGGSAVQAVVFLQPCWYGVPRSVAASAPSGKEPRGDGGPAMLPSCTPCAFSPSRAARVTAARGGTAAFPRSERSAPLQLVQHPPAHPPLPSVVPWLPQLPCQPRSCT